MKVTAILKGATDKLGRTPVQIRINDGDKRSYISTKIKVKKSDWDSKTGRIKASAPNAKVCNDFIKTRILKAELGELFTEKKKESRADFYEYAEKCIAGWEKSKAYNTLRDYAVQLGKLKKFSVSLSLQEIDVAWLNDYKEHLYNKTSTSAVWKAFKFLRLIVRKAFREGVIASYPFARFENIVYKAPRKKFLTKEQVEKIEKELQHLPSGLKFACTWFLIGCYTGLRYSDMHAFDKEKNIIGDRLILSMQKTGETIGMLLLPKARALLGSIDYEPLHFANQPFNRLLKDITHYIGLPFPLTAHASRHSFAMMCADAGITQDVVGKFLGHQDARSTAVYFKMTNKRLDDELKKLG